MNNNTMIQSILTKEFDKYQQYFAKNDMLKCIKKYCREESLDLKELRAMDEFDHTHGMGKRGF